MDAEALREKILRLPGGNKKLPQAREIGVLIVDMIDDEDQLEVLLKAADTGSIAEFEEALIGVMEEEGLDKDAFELPEDEMSLQIPLDEQRKSRLNFVQDLLFNAGGGGGTLIAEKVFSCLPFVCEFPRLTLVCKTWEARLKENVFWKPIALKVWPGLGRIGNKIDLVKNWKLFTAARLTKLKNAKSRRGAGKKMGAMFGVQMVPPIENCAMGLELVEKKRQNGGRLPDGFKWDFKCPVALSKISTTRDHKVDYCSVCKQNVYVVQTEEELKSHVSKGNCVALDFDKTILASRQRPRPMPILRGRVRLPRPAPIGPPRPPALR
uniref:Uncharacterized protein n=1 Tax=Lotharella oceanica TaxID=641309 RepID=A0A7S2XB18_9EUKA